MTGRNKNNHSRDRILSRLEGKEYRPWHENWPSEVPEGDVFPPVDDPLAMFRDELTSLGGEVFVEEGEGALYKRLKEIVSKRGWKVLFTGDNQIERKLDQWDIPVRQFVSTNDEPEAGVTGCEALVARTGSVMVSSAGASGRQMNIFLPVHIVVAGLDQVVSSIADGFRMVRENHSHLPSQISLISGPSRTADIEKTLVMGAHGPGELIVLIDAGPENS
ncbi:MAG: lactate utilization protein [Marinilabilia sp.]